MKKIYLFPITLLLSYFVTLSKIHAQSTTLSVSPPVVEILLAPTKQVVQTFTLMTQGEAVDITPELHLAIPSDDQGHMTIDPSPLNPASLPLAFTISQNGPVYTLTLEAANTDVPQDIYLALVFRASPLESDVSRLTSTLPSISALLLVTINPEGGTPVDLRVEDFTLPKIHDSWLPLTIEPTLSNNSPIMIRPQGLYEIISPSGKTILSLPLYPNLILGNSSRLLQSTIDHRPSTIIFTPRWSNLGPHRLRLTITTEGGTKLTQLEKVIWLLPIRIIVFLTVITAIITILLTSVYKYSRFKTV